MAYIAAVNPAILVEAGMPFDAALTSTCFGAAFSLLMSDFFDTMGGVVAVGRPGGFANEKGEVEDLQPILAVDSLGAAIGGFLGASSITVYVESAVGAAAGARTGLSNIVIAAVRKIIPDNVRIPCFIVIIAGFVTLISFVMQRFLPGLYESLGVFLTLITVNCIILGRAEAFASKNKVLPSVLDGLGMGLGFTGALFVMGSLREIFGAGSWFGIKLPLISQEPMLIFIMPAGGFFVLGCVIALVNKLAKKKPPEEISCENCPSAAVCGRDKAGCKALSPAESEAAE